MASFRYRILRPTGVEAEGELDAEDAHEAALRLQSGGDFPIEITQAAGSRRAGSGRTGATRLPDADLILFTRQLATLIGAGVPVDRSLSRLATDGTRRGLLARTLLFAVQRGEQLSAACRGCAELPPHFGMAIAAGESRGAIATALERIGTVLERQRSIGRSLTSALLYPATVLVVGTVSVSFLLIFVMPRFETLLTTFRHDPPLTVRLLLGASNLLQVLALPGLLCVAVAAAYVALRWRNVAFRLGVHRRLLTVPWLGTLLAKVEAERVAFTLGHLVAAGVTVPEALTATGEATSSVALRYRLSEVRQRIERGDGIASSLAALGILPDLALELVRVGEETDQVAPMLIKASDILQGEIAARGTDMIGLIAPVSTILLGLLIGAIAYAIFDTLMEVYDLAV